MLESLGIRVDVAENGARAVEAAQNLDYDLILMDCQMPGVNGYEATEMIRRWETAEKASGRVPIIALTANAMQGDREVCMAAGMDDYLAKPFTTQDFVAILKRWAASDRPGKTENSDPVTTSTSSGLTL
jgi:CheY-like chemotaxis protein